MEIASSEVIALVLNQMSPVRARRRSRTPAAGRSMISNRRRDCRCGECRKCLENARWERIFAEKFADPDYYGGLVVRSASPLTSL